MGICVFFRGSERRVQCNFLWLLARRAIAAEDGRRWPKPKARPWLGDETFFNKALYAKEILKVVDIICKLFRF